MEFWRKGLEGSYRLRVSIARHGYHVFFSTHINSRRIRIDDRQQLQINASVCIGFAFFPAHSYLPLFNDGAGSARRRNRFTNLSNGVEPP